MIPHVLDREAGAGRRASPRRDEVSAAKVMAADHIGPTASCTNQTVRKTGGWIDPMTNPGVV
jgi:hypothetical protein